MFDVLGNASTRQIYINHEWRCHSDFDGTLFTNLKHITEALLEYASLSVYASYVCSMSKRCSCSPASFCMVSAHERGYICRRVINTYMLHTLGTIRNATLESDFFRLYCFWLPTGSLTKKNTILCYPLWTQRQ